MKFDFDTRPSDSPFVESVWRTETAGGGSFISTAESRWEMVITKQMGKFTLSIRGPETKASPALVPEGHVEFFGIVFKRAVFMPNLQKKYLVNEALHLPQSTRNAFTAIGGVFEIPTFENADTFVTRLMRNELLTHDQIVDDVLRGQTRDLSLRSLQRRFLHVTGLTYKTIQQIDRARQALTMLQEGKPIVDVVYEAGYFDQPHLTRSLKLFAGQTPSEIQNNRPAGLIAE
ncbi:MAG: helix-turn-helix domain-containing protein [Anaerolineae bacterium]|nr:helix-turn-helix domain-containing protein [Anaerolineae bacterium]